MSGPNLQRPPMSTVACRPSQAPSGMRIDVALERRAARERVVLALGVVGLRAAGSPSPKASVPRKLGGMQSRRDSTRLRAGDGAGSFAAGDQAEVAVRRALDALHRASQHDRAAVGFDVPFQRQHQAVAVDDARGGRQQRRRRSDSSGSRSRAALPPMRLQVGDAVLGRRLPDGGELRQLALAGSPPAACRSGRAARCSPRRSGRAAPCRARTASRAGCPADSRCRRGSPRCCASCVSEPISSCCSSTSTPWPAWARARATARPTTPAPTTMVSTSAVMAARMQ